MSLPPLVTDSNGITWYRAAGSSSAFTAQIEYADPGYFTADSPQPPNRKESTTVTEMNFKGEADTARYSDFMRYPLPPLLAREEVQFDGWGRYKLPSPTTGKPTSYTRTTTVSSTTADHFGLSQWKIRTKVGSVLRAQYLAQNINSNLSDTEMALAAAFIEYEKAVKAGKGGDINKAIDLIDDLAGGADSRELGGAVHDWLGELDMGKALMHQIPEMFQPYALAYQDCLQRAGLIAVPTYVERVVLNDRGEESIAGRIDRIYLCVETGELYLGDLKTSKSLDLALMEYGIQFATYGYATLMLGLDGLTWEPMPEINQDYAICVHVPSDQPERSQAVPFDMYAGGEGLITAIEVRKQRKEIPKRILGHTTPIPSKESLRYVAARQALQNMTDPADAGVIREAFEDIWTDDLNEFGATCFGLLTATNNEEN